MIIGCPKEVKPGETRVGLTPEWVKKLAAKGHRVHVQATAGALCGYSDDEFKNAGAVIEEDIESIYKNCEFIVKVKELMTEEYPLLRENQIVWAFFHLAEDVDHPQLDALLSSKSIALGMELIVLPDGTRPTIKPMSEIAGSLAMLEAVKYGLAPHGGKGILYRKLSGLPAPKVLILGGGHAGLCAAEIALGLGLQITIIENYWKRIAELRYMLSGVDVVYWEDETARRLVVESDVLLNTIYPKPGQPCLIKRELVKQMKKDAVLIDIVGVGVIETMHYTTIEEPIYFDEGLLHYNVPNMPAMCPKTSTQALVMAAGPYIEAIADKGLKQALTDDACLRSSVCTLDGKIVNAEAAENHQRSSIPFELSMLK